MIEKILVEIRKKLQELTNSDSVKKLEEYRQKFSREFDEAIDKFYQKRDLLLEAVKKKSELRNFKLSTLQKLKKAGFPVALRQFISAPFIYGMIIPAIFLHICLEIYHQICFRLYRIPLSKPSQHFVFDRIHLAYLNPLEKINCLYCSYFNGLMSYSREISGKTERYWCPIKHAQRLKDPHGEYGQFCDYLDGKCLRKNWDKLRKF